MSKNISMDTIQKCQQTDMAFAKPWFINLINQMPQEDFNRFCREVAHLNHHHDTSVGLIVSDQHEVGIAFPEVTWTLEEINFDSPINFKQIS